MYAELLILLDEGMRCKCGDPREENTLPCWLRVHSSVAGKLAGFSENAVIESR